MLGKGVAKEEKHPTFKMRPHLHGCLHVPEHHLVFIIRFVLGRGVYRGVQNSFHWGVETDIFPVVMFLPELITESFVCSYLQPEWLWERPFAPFFMSLFLERCGHTLGVQLPLALSLYGCSSLT